ncbi:MAG: nitroreductase family protein [Planctomycetaceae bacterium]|nr:nitroreductase family protein [Planctomycetaceae bacterium]
MELLRELCDLQEEHGYLSDDTLRDLSTRKRVPLYRLEGLVSFYPHFRRTPPAAHRIHVCRDVSCAMASGEQLAAALRTEFAGRADVEIHEVSCIGRCDAAPAVAWNEKPLAPRTLADTDFIAGLIDGTKQLDTEKAVSRKWKCDSHSSTDEQYGSVRDLAASGQLASTCIETLKDCNLRGMGGAGFPTGRKWELVAAEPASPKYVICNADESEPGTFKDRLILAEIPHLVIEGMLLAGLTIGAESAIVYLRHEYTRELAALHKAIEDARSRGVLGDDAAGSGKSFDIDVFISPGGYILGEETALLEALEDKRGEPRIKPPYPGTHGLNGQPTLINNVETFALATSMIRNGADWWREQGAGDIEGLKFVSISGDVANPGVYEIPVGTTVSELIDLAGGMSDGKSLKAFLPGGASSKFLPAEKASTPMDFAAMQAAGSMLGTGAVIVMSEDRDLFALATNLVRFFRNESCGKCVPCRVGSEKTVVLLDAVACGSGTTEDLSFLPQLGDTLEQTSICGLGQVALNPILSMMEHFPGEVPSAEK